MNLDRLRRGFDEILPEEEFEERFGGQSSRRVKLGVDPTGSELHLGHAVIFNKLRQFQDAGHTVVFLVGDFTARIGDPSGRDETRPPLSAEEVEEHARTYTNQAFEILDEDRTEVVYNSDWLDDLGTSGMLDLASRMTVARMLERDDFSKRFDNNKSIRLHEFLYPLLQGYDSVEIEADLELGGTDQKFNLLVGRQLQKEMTDQEPQLIGTLPLLVGLDGSKKMSKSYDNHIPLETSAQDMFGKLMSIPDHLVKHFAELLTDFSEDFFQDLDEKVSDQDVESVWDIGQGEVRIEGLDLKQEKKKVAHAIVQRLKGENEADEAQDYFERTIEENQAPDEEEMETFEVTERDVWIVDLLDQSGLVESRSEAKRLLREGGIYLDGEQLDGFDYDVPMDQPVTLRRGKHQYRRAVPTENGR
jgi:tyrosyl-tRNA synthetase